MRKYVLCFCLIFLFPMIILGQIPKVLSFQGILTDNTGNPLSGDQVLVFKLYAMESGGTAIWQETQTIQVEEGLFNAILGSVTPLNLAFEQPYWLGITIGTSGTELPRIQLTAAAYSLNAHTVMDNAITTGKIEDGAVTQAKLAPGVSLPPGGTAGGDLTGSYPNPAIAANAVTGDKIADGNVDTPDLADGAVTQAKLGPGVSLPPGGTAGGDLTGSYPNPAIATNAVTGVKIADGNVDTPDLADGAVTQAKLGPGVSLPPGGTAGGDLTGSYPNPAIAANAVTGVKIANGNVDTPDLADGAVTQAKLGPGVSLPPGGTAGGDLTGSYPNPAIAANAVTGDKIADSNVDTPDLADGAVTQAKLGPGVSLPPGGTAGGDLTGSYPNPAIAANAVTGIKIADGNVDTPELADGAVTQAKLGPGISLPPAGAAGGDFSGTYPNPTVAKIQGQNVASTAPALGEVLQWDGSSWTSASSPGGPPSGPAGGDLSGSYPNPAIATNAVTSGKIQNGSVNTADLAPNAVTLDKISPNVLTSIDGVSNDGGNVDLIAGSYISISPNNSNKTITISTSGVGDISGSGTSNYLAKFTGTKSIGNSLIYDAGKQVGIGTTTPAYKLTVIDNTTAEFTLSAEKVAGSSSNAAILGSNSASPGAEFVAVGGIFESTATTSAAKYGLIGQATGGTSTNVGGFFKATGGSQNFGIVSLADKNQFDGRVGIGTSSPDTDSKLHVVHNGLHAGLFSSSNLSSSTYIVNSEYTGTAGNQDVRAFYGSSTPNDGWGYGGYFVGGYMGSIGSADAGGYTGSAFGVYGRATATGAAGTRYGVFGTASGGATNYAVYASGDLVYTGELYEISDAKFKEELSVMGSVLPKLLKIEANTYSFSENVAYAHMNLAKGKHYGFIAQDLEKIFPEMVSEIVHPSAEESQGERGGDMLKFKGINYIEMIPILVKALQEQQQQIEELKTEVAQLKGQ